MMPGSWAKQLVLILCALGWLGGFSSLALAQTSPKIEIIADSFSVRENQSRSEFSGNVVVSQPGLKIWADKVIVHYGSGGTSDIKSFEALGNVRIKSDKQTATGDRAVYDPKTRIMILTGNVMLVNASASISAAQLRVDLNSNVTEFSTSNDGGRVTGVFTANN